jgi:hypothetical protein
MWGKRQIGESSRESSKKCDFSEISAIKWW